MSQFLSPPPTRAPTVFERHLQTGIQILLVALLAWAGIELVNLGKSTAVLQERLVYQGQLINDLRSELRDWSGLYYRKSDAEREIGSLKNDVRRLNERVHDLEEQRP